MKNSPLNPSMSLWLDIIRFAAAMLVVLGHAKNSLLPELHIYLAMHSVEAVAIFFVLSGYVISYITSIRSTTVLDYTLDRASRIYSVALLAIFFTIICDVSGIIFYPDQYGAIRESYNNNLILKIITSVLFLNEVWSINLVIGTLGPYWSLGYEVAYYIAFAIFILPTTKAVKIGLSAAWLLLYGPWIAAYGVIWLIGVLAYQLTVTSAVKQYITRHKLTWVLIFAPILAYPILRYTLDLDYGSFYHRRDLGQEILLFIYYSTIGALFALHLIGFNAASASVKFGPRFAKCIRWLAGSTFTIYLMHLPLMDLLTAYAHTNNHGVLARYVALGVIMIAMFALSYAGERQKTFWKSLLSIITKRTALA